LADVGPQAAVAVGLAVRRSGGKEMIRINLLPITASRRPDAVRAELVLAGLIFLGLAGSLAALTARVHVQVANMTEENDRLTKEIERLKVIVGEVDKAEKLKGDLETKLKAIQDKKKT